MKPNEYFAGKTVKAWHEWLFNHTDMHFGEITLSAEVFRNILKIAELGDAVVQQARGHHFATNGCAIVENAISAYDKARFGAPLSSISYCHHGRTKAEIISGACEGCNEALKRRDWKPCVECGDPSPKVYCDGCAGDVLSAKERAQNDTAPGIVPESIAATAVADPRLQTPQPVGSSDDLKVNLTMSEADWWALTPERRTAMSQAGWTHTKYVRPAWDDNFIEHARVTAKMSTCPRALKYGGIGTVLVRDRQLLSTGFCGSIRKGEHCCDVGCIIDPATEGCIRTVHAETNAVLNAASHGVKLEGATAYITMSPCWACFRTLANAGIVRIVYETEYRLGVKREREFAQKLGIKFEQWGKV